jgi:hypothetical protein
MCPSLLVWVLVMWDKHMAGGSCSLPTFSLSVPLSMLGKCDDLSHGTFFDFLDFALHVL